MNDGPTPWLQRRFVPAAIVCIAISLALCYLAIWGERTDNARYSVFGWAATLVPPFFIGAVTGLGRPRSAARSALALTGIALLVVAPLFGESFFCVLMLSPVYLAITPLIAVLVRAIFQRASAGTRAAVLLLPWGLFLADRPVIVSELPVQTISDSVVLPGSPAAVWRAIDRLDLEFATPEPAFVRWGLSVPRVLHGAGAHVGAVRRLVFHNGTLVATVTESAPPRRFALALGYEDPGTEFFDHWVALEDTVFELAALPAGGTRLTHTTRYRRLVRPEPWFLPFERFGAHLLQGYLLRSFAERAAFDLGPVAGF